MGISFLELVRGLIRSTIKLTKIWKNWFQQLATHLRRDRL